MRALYDPPFFFELSSVCMTVYKKDSEESGYVKYRQVSLPDAKRIYPDVYEVLATDAPNERCVGSLPELTALAGNLKLN